MMAGRGLVLFSILFLVSDVVSELVDPWPQNKAVVNGAARVAFDCTSSTDWNYISWNVLPVGGSTKIISIGSSVVAPYQDTCNLSNTKGHTSTLTIKTVNESLAGTYTCSEPGFPSASAQLIVYNADPVCTSNVSSPLYQDQTVQMSCSFNYTANNSSVGVNMTWSFINGSSSYPVQSPSPVITTTRSRTTAVSTITPTVGYSSPFPVYKCQTSFTVTGNTATNAATNVPDSTNTSQPYNSPITVYYFNPSCSIKDAKDGDKVLFGTTIRCEVDANPPPSYRWSNGTNATLSSAKSVEITNDGQYTYTCTASNVAGNCTRSITLTAYTTTAPPTTATTTTITPPTTSSPPVMPPGDKSPPSEGLSETNKIIIGVVVGVGGFILLVAIILIVCWCMKKNKSGAKYENGTAKPAAERPPPYDGHVGPQRPSRPDSVDYASVDRQYQNASQSPYASGSPAHPRIGDDGLNYAQIQLDNQPRSRQPLQVPQNNSNYVEIALA